RARGRNVRTSSSSPSASTRSGATASTGRVRANSASTSARAEPKSPPTVAFPRSPRRATSSRGAASASGVDERGRVTVDLLQRAHRLPRGALLRLLLRGPLPRRERLLADERLDDELLPVVGARGVDQPVARG